MSFLTYWTVGEESGKWKRWMIGRGVAVMILSIALFAVVFLVAGLAGLFLTGNLERAGLTGGVCGFATAWLTNTVYTVYIVRRRTGGETRREAGNPEDGSEDGVNRRSSNRSEPAEVPLTCLTNKDRRGRDELRRSLSRLHRS